MKWVKCMIKESCYHKSQHVSNTKLFQNIWFWSSHSKKIKVENINTTLNVIPNASYILFTLIFTNKTCKVTAFSREKTYTHKENIKSWKDNKNKRHI